MFLRTTHAVVVVGWGTDKVSRKVLNMGGEGEINVPYWLVRNSWGPSWGERGYFKIAIYDRNNRFNRFINFVGGEAAEGVGVTAFKMIGPDKPVPVTDPSRGDCKECERQLASITREAEKLARDLTEEKGKGAELRRASQKCTQNLLLAQASLKTCTQDKDKLESRLRAADATCESKKRELNATIDSLGKQLIDAATECARKKTSLDDKIAELEKKLIDKGLCATLRDELTELKVKHDEVQKALDAARAELATCATKSPDCKAQTDKLQKEIADLKTKLAKALNLEKTPIKFPLWSIITLVILGGALLSLIFYVIRQVRSS